MLRRLSLVVSAVLVCVTSILAPPARAGQVDDIGRDAAAAAAWAEGWSLRPASPGTAILRWELAGPLPMQDARPEFRDGDVVLGHPTVRAGGLELLVPASATIDEPELWLGARRLDAPTPDRRIAVAPVDDRSADATGRRDPVVLPATQDPARRGPYRVERLVYDLAGLDVGYPVPLEVVGEVVAPVDAPGRRPLVLFLHGRHATCYDRPDGFVTGDWPCPPGTQPIPSHEGYRYVARLLASQGYVTVSISANGVNAQDFASNDGGAAARARLVRHHLRLWASWAAGGGGPFGDRFAGGVDLDRVVLVGHSRGGEGVNRAAVDSRPGDPYRLRGLVSIGPTTFGRQVPGGLPQTVLLPYCDGDVSDLQGQQLVDQTRDLVSDDTAVRSAVMVLGANHNFFNTEWTPGIAKAPSDDDWGFSGPDDDPVCGGASRARLTPAEQQAVGAVYIAASIHVAITRDPVAARLLDGSDVVAPSAGRAKVLVHALGGRRTTVYRPATFDRLSAVDVLARPCRSLVAGEFGASSECAPGIAGERLPHWLGMFAAETAPGTKVLELAWRRAGGSATVTLPAPVAVPAGRHLELRVIADPEVGAARFGVRVTDGSGRSVVLPGTARVAPLPGDRAPLAKLWAQTVRFRLPAGLDELASIAVVPASDRGRVWLLDASTWAPGVPQPAVAPLPRVSVPRVTVTETDRAQLVEVPLVIEGRVRTRAVLWAHVVVPDAPARGQLVVLEPGQTRATVTLRIPGDDLYAPPLGGYTIGLKAIRNAVTGRYLGGVRVLEDEPAPTVTFTAASPVREGEEIVFRVTLSDPVGTYLYFPLQLGPHGPRPLLDTDDVPAEWLSQFVESPPDDPVPLPAVVFAFAEVAPGEVTAEFRIPLLADGVAEGNEGLRATIPPGDNPIVTEALVANVVVRDAP